MTPRNTPRPLPRSGRRRSGRAQLDVPQDPYKEIKKRHEPSVCPQCGAVYHQGRWQWLTRPADAQEELCQACHRINDRYPAGILTLSGTLVAQHRTEMIGLARHQEEVEKKEHPLNRIIDIEEAPERIVINTTDIHLPRRIAEALKRAWRGKTDFHYDEDAYFLRVNWHRDA
jgi:NMD protein affecting ribosome stability and mRNA decay